MHYFEITDKAFAREIAEYLPKEAFKPTKYLLVTLTNINRTILITEIPKLGEVMDGLSFRKQCRRISRKVVLTVKHQIGEESLQEVIGNIVLWHEL